MSTDRHETTMALLSLSRSARAYHDELWAWLWRNNEPQRTIGDKKAELRTRYGLDAEQELMRALRADGLISEKNMKP